MRFDRSFFRVTRKSLIKLGQKMLTVNLWMISEESLLSVLLIVLYGGFTSAVSKCFWNCSETEPYHMLSAWEIRRRFVQIEGTHLIDSNWSVHSIWSPLDLQWNNNNEWLSCILTNRMMQYQVGRVISLIVSITLFMFTDRTGFLFFIFFMIWITYNSGDSSWQTCFNEWRQSISFII